MFTQLTGPNKKVNLIFGTSVIIVMNPITLFQNVSTRNAKIKKENGILILDRNHLRNPPSNTFKHTRIKFIEMGNLNPTL